MYEPRLWGIVGCYALDETINFTNFLIARFNTVDEVVRLENHKWMPEEILKSALRMGQKKLIQKLLEARYTLRNTPQVIKILIEVMKEAGRKEDFVSFSTQVPADSDFDDYASISSRGKLTKEQHEGFLEIESPKQPHRLRSFVIRMSKPEATGFSICETGTLIVKTENPNGPEQIEKIRLAPNFSNEAEFESYESVLVLGALSDEEQQKALGTLRRNRRDIREFVKEWVNISEKEMSPHLRLFKKCKMLVNKYLDHYVFNNLHLQDSGRNTQSYWREFLHFFKWTCISSLLNSSDRGRALDVINLINIIPWFLNKVCQQSPAVYRG